MTITQERRERRLILSLSGAGKVREYQLKLTVQYQVSDNKGKSQHPHQRNPTQRIPTYDDSRIIAKQLEEAQLYQDMERTRQRKFWRMTAIKR